MAVAVEVETARFGLAESEREEHPHLLVIEGIEESGIPRFTIYCPARWGENCPESADGPFVGCIVRHELEQIGREIIEGSADGPGPWPVKLVYDFWNNMEDAEAWIRLL